MPRVITILAIFLSALAMSGQIVRLECELALVVVDDATTTWSFDDCEIIGSDADVWARFSPKGIIGEHFFERTLFYLPSEQGAEFRGVSYGRDLAALASEFQSDSIAINRRHAKVVITGDSVDCIVVRERYGHENLCLCCDVVKWYRPNEWLPFALQFLDLSSSVPRLFVESGLVGNQQYKIRQKDESKRIAISGNTLTVDNLQPFEGVATIVDFSGIVYSRQEFGSGVGSLSIDIGSLTIGSYLLVISYPEHEQLNVKYLVDI